MKSFFAVLVSFLAVCAMSEATVYTVGDTTGWGVPSNSDFYDNWENNKVFTVGDQLVFNWNGMHDVVSVSEAQYDACTKVTTNVMSTSPATVNLTAAGDFHFICTIGTHCSSGQKLSIEVVAASTTGSPPSTTTSPPSTTTNTTSTPSSSSVVFGPVAAVSAALTALAFFV